MVKLLILAALLIFSSKTDVSSVGTTTSLQQHNPQAGADKDPCEVHLSMLYLRLFTTRSHVLHDASICLPQFTTHVCQDKWKTNPSSIISFQRQSKTLRKKCSFRVISTTLRDQSMFRADSPKNEAKFSTRQVSEEAAVLLRRTRKYQ